MAFKIALFCLQDLEQGLELVSRLAQGRGYYVILHIMEYLDLEDLAEFEAAGTDFQLSLRKIAGPYSKRVREAIFARTEKRYSGDLKLDRIRLWTLCPDDLLREVRCVLGLNNFRAISDHVALPLSAIKPLVAFNPKYDVAAIAQSKADSLEPKTFQVVSYGGFVRQRAGQILYYDSGLGYCFDCPIYHFMSWNNSGTHLLVGVRIDQLTPLVDLWLFQFDPATCSFRKCLTAGLELRGYLSVLSSNLWLTDTTFMWARDHESPLYTVTINKNREVTKVRLNRTLGDMFEVRCTSGQTKNIELEMREAPFVTAQDEILQRATNFGNLFATSSFGQNLDGVLPAFHRYLFCVLKCPVHFEQHDCIAVIDRRHLKLVMLLNVRGHVLEIKTVLHRVFVLYAELTEFASADWGADTPFASYSRSAENYNRCSFGLTMKSPPLPDFADYTTNTMWFNSDNPLQGRVELCPNCSLPEVPSYHEYMGGAQLEPFRQTAMSNYLYPTKDFVAFVVEGESEDDTYGLDEVSGVSARLYTTHHFSPGRLFDNLSPHFTFYHPTRPIRYDHRGPKQGGNTFGLTSNAHYSDVLAFHPPLNKVPFFDRVYNEPLVCQLKPPHENLESAHGLTMDL